MVREIDQLALLEFTSCPSDLKCTAWHSQKHHEDVDQRDEAPVGGIEPQGAGGVHDHPPHRRGREPNQDANDVEEQVASDLSQRIRNQPKSWNNWWCSLRSPF